ncbi:MAG: Asp-tRNA(Asn)/Glu-tRNA(Gln) amidotransferase GatCAB subunit A [Candidatus Nealsonbacteria bacterium CG_4_10_14_0_2_um_filter_38_17]|uniref:Glutamyl-tRNA(Gln) amidotransferase subunit A n=2 Tax=Candidatus Nealsoniibacteriota TaxID=1817911 RepID=A0A2M7UXW1_9BACT|nr:MAG: Asp-tRNA(Asn)/Glu-tRNA(Gln) amidotransferase GatCAB subunit A [Candidatus Nealsonbacteria bacterium CG23_combo_of_CG06-09_8_20_14_all_38_19]PIZ88758.1 MAG: Asp-tRNA(Asn)/Glu-tRNA(Gln) amidotransferase GatCAB subunit A [Candidatus Nealsonbacteria bacterium CG_4_10_14_0_2_um_filter_38_17]
MDLTQLTITQTHEGLKKKDFSVLELTKIYLDKIQKENKEIFAFLTVSAELALRQAKEVDEKIAKKEKIDVLAGVPCALKDNILVEGGNCTAGSKILENYIAPYDATVTKKLKNRGAVILGKTNLDEFAMGSSTENSGFGPTKNPWDKTRVPGGSSGGSAAAVASNMACYALGSDTGGSIRQPASFCGVVGLKPTYGAISRYGLIAMASSLDQIGPIAKTVEDCETVFEAISGKDSFDSTSLDRKYKIQNTKYKILNTKIGIPKEYFIRGMDSEVEKRIRGVIKNYQDMGAKIEEISLPHTKYALATYYIIVPSEISANLARYDGIKYGLSITQNSKLKAQNLIDVYLQSREKGFGDEVTRRIMLGTYTLSAGYYDAYYKRAQKVRTLIRKDFSDAFKKVDVILTPTTPTTAFKLGEKVNDPLTMYLADIFTIAVNLAGLPAISVPCPVRNSNGPKAKEKDSPKNVKKKISNGVYGKIKELPIGFQIIGKPFEENIILEAGKAFKKLSSFK